jgi:arginine decarboxylase
MWADKQRFIMLPINKWNVEYQRVILGGLTCDNDDYYNVISEDEELFLPVIEPDDVEPLYVGFFHTGAYQDSLSGYGGVHHCLIPSPKHILVDVDEDGNLTYKLFAPEQRSQEVMKLLGYI